jgi:nucleotide-binding universal stress UspA family protein
MKILLAYDGGAPALRALTLTSQLALRFDADVSVESVIPVHPGRVPVDPWDDASIHRVQLAEAKRLLFERGIQPVLIEQAGDPAGSIERIAEEGGFDMVVVGSRGLGPVARALQGSVSTHVATHAASTVVIAR